MEDPAKQNMAVKCSRQKKANEKAPKPVLHADFP